MNRFILNYLGIFLLLLSLLSFFNIIYSYYFNLYLNVNTYFYTLLISLIIGFNLAKNIENTFEDARLKIIEKDKSRAEFIANELNNTIVINGNGLDEDILAEVN